MVRDGNEGGAAERALTACMIGLCGLHSRGLLQLARLRASRSRDAARA